MVNSNGTIQAGFRRFFRKEIKLLLPHLFPEDPHGLRILSHSQFGSNNYRQHRKSVFQITPRLIKYMRLPMEVQEQLAVVRNIQAVQ